MTKQIRQGGKKGRKIGREARHPSHAAYKRNNRRFSNKLRRILRSNGAAAARVYAAKYGAGRITNE